MGKGLLRSLMVLVLLAALPAMAGHAQIAPGAREIAAYKKQRGLHDAAHRNDLKRLRALLAAGADPNARDRFQRTPAHVAAHASNSEALRILVRGGADINALEFQRYDVITIAAVANDRDLVALAVKLGGNPGLTTSLYDGTALIAAAHLGHVGVVKTLIKAGAPLDHVNNLGWTALMEAVVLGDGGRNHLEVVRALLAAGASKSIPDRNGITPLQHARLRGFDEIVKALEQGNRD